MNMLAFDLGASSGKIFQGKFDGRSLALKQVSRFNNHPVTIRDELFWDVLDIFRNLKNGISLSLQAGEEITSIGLDSFSNDFGLLDQDGRLLTQVHCYRDSRTKRNEEGIYSAITREKLYQLSGNQNALFGTFMQLASMCLEKQRYLLDGSNSLLFIPDLLAYFLTGEIHSEYTISSVSQMLDFRTGTWSPEILSTFSIPERLFPKVITPGTPVGTILPLTIDSTEKRDIQVISVCEHDTASAFLAAPFGEDSIIISSGTWSLVGIETSDAIINDYAFVHNIANEGGFPGHHRLLKNVMGQWIIQECQRTFAEKGLSHDIVQLIGLAAREKAFQFMIDPDDERFFSPGNMPGKVQSYCSKHFSTCPETPGQIIRTIVDSLALKYRLVIEELETATGRTYNRINIIGGGSKNDLLNQSVANVTGRPVIAGPDEATALGNLLVQLIAANEVGSVADGREIIKQSFPTRTYHPENRPESEAAYQQYQKMNALKEYPHVH